MICDRCGAEFVYMQELTRSLKMDIYVKREFTNINGKRDHRWERCRLCPDCDTEMYAKFIEKR